jgi:hypothetical protein
LILCKKIEGNLQVVCYQNVNKSPLRGNLKRRLTFKASLQLFIYVSPRFFLLLSIIFKAVAACKSQISLKLQELPADAHSTADVRVAGDLLILFSSESNAADMSQPSGVVCPWAGLNAGASAAQHDEHHHDLACRHSPDARAVSGVDSLLR